MDSYQAYKHLYKNDYYQVGRDKDATIIVGYGHNTTVLSSQHHRNTVKPDDWLELLTKNKKRLNNGKKRIALDYVSRSMGDYPREYCAICGHEEIDFAYIECGVCRWCLDYYKMAKIRRTELPPIYRPIGVKKYKSIMLYHAECVHIYSRVKTDYTRSEYIRLTAINKPEYLPVLILNEYISRRHFHAHIMVRVFPIIDDIKHEISALLIHLCIRVNYDL